MIADICRIPKNGPPGAPPDNSTDQLSALANDLVQLRGPVVRTEVLLIITTLLLLCLAALGSFRRRSSHWFIQRGVPFSYVTSISVLAATIAWMKSSPVKSEIEPVWAVSVFTLYASVDSITAMSLSGPSQAAQNLLKSFTHYAFLLSLIFTSNGEGGPSILLIVLYILTHIKFRYAQQTDNTATSLWTNKTVSDYMDLMDPDLEDERHPNPADTMEGYPHLLVQWPLRKVSLKSPRYALEFPASASKDMDWDQVTTIDKIWMNKGVKDYHDVCLAYSMFLLLKRRIFGYDFDESKRAPMKTRAHALKGLLTTTERAFKVIDLELSFMYDLHYTNYPAHHDSKTLIFFLSVASVILVSSLAYFTAVGKVKMLCGSDDKEFILIKANTYDLALALFILASILVVDVARVVIYWTSGWGKVNYACDYVRDQLHKARGRPCCCVRLTSSLRIGLKGLLAKMYFFPNSYHWSNKVSQVILVERKRSRRLTKVLWLATCTAVPVVVQAFFLGSVAVLLKTLQDIRDKNVHLVYCRDVKLPDEVKEAIAEYLRRNMAKDKEWGLTLSNGADSLKRNEVADILAWACEPVHPIFSDRGSQTDIILAWHIATCYCKMQVGSEEDAWHLSTCCCKTMGPSWASEETQEKKHRGHIRVATTLSEYCAYLVIYVPKLLPGKDASRYS